MLPINNVDYIIYTMPYSLTDTFVYRLFLTIYTYQITIHTDTFVYPIFNTHL